MEPLGWPCPPITSGVCRGAPWVAMPPTTSGECLGPFGTQSCPPLLLGECHGAPGVPMPPITSGECYDAFWYSNLPILLDCQTTVGWTPKGRPSLAGHRIMVGGAPLGQSGLLIIRSLKRAGCRFHWGGGQPLGLGLSRVARGPPLGVCVGMPGGTLLGFVAWVARGRQLILVPTFGSASSALSCKHALLTADVRPTSQITCSCIRGPLARRHIVGYVPHSGSRPP